MPRVFFCQDPPASYAKTPTFRRLLHMRLGVAIMNIVTPQQNRLFRAVHGAVMCCRSAHPNWNLNRTIAISVAKRAAGTILAQWPGLLAARLPERAEEGSRVLQSTRSGAAVGKAPAGSGGRRNAPGRRPSLKVLWRYLGYLAGQAKHAGNMERYETLRDVLRLIAEMEQGTYPPTRPVRTTKRGRSPAAP